MFELVVRCCLATALLIVSGAARIPTFDLSLKVAALFAAYSFLAYALERRGLRNPGVSALIALADSGIVAFLVAALGQVETFGFLALLPPAWAVARHGSDPLAMAPIVAAWLLMASSLFGGRGWTPVLLTQVVGVFFIGLAGARRESHLHHHEVDEPDGHHAVEGDVSTDYLSLREKFRVLRDHAGDLERRSRKDRLASQMSEAVCQEPENAMAALSHRLQETLKVDGLTLFAIQQDSGKLVVQATVGDVPNQSRDTAITLPEFRAEWQLQERLGNLVKSLKTPEDTQDSGTMILKDKGRIVGLLALFDRSQDKLAAALDLAVEAAEFIGKFVRQIQSRDEERKRLRQAEFLYMVASTAQGAATPEAMACRVAREAWDSLRLDHLSVYFLEEGEPSLVTSHGATVHALDLLQYPNQPGVEGWLEAGCPVMHLPNAREGSHFQRDEAIKRRIGSLLLLPLSESPDTPGFLLATTHRVDGIDQATLETLRIATSELGLTMARRTSDSTDAAGLATPAEFREAITRAGAGHLVYLEVLRREELVEAHGKPAVEHGLIRLAVRIRSLLPPGALLTRRVEGDYVAFLRTDDPESARSWASNVSATASLVALTTPDGKHRLPLGLRSKVALIPSQTDQISTVKAS